VKEIAELDAHDSYVLGMRFTDDSQTLISSGMDNAVKLWSVSDWTLMQALEAHRHSVNSIAHSPDGKILATGSSDQTVKLWSFPNLDLLQTVQDRKQVVSAVTISPDGKWVCAGSYGGRAALWTLHGEQVLGIKASQKNLSSVAISPDGSTLSTSGLGDDIRLWSLPAGEPVGTLQGHKVAVGSLNFLEGGATLISMGYEGTVRFWNTADWREKDVVSLEPTARGLVVSPDGKRAVLSLEAKVQVFQLVPWELEVELPIPTKSIGGMAFSPDGTWLAVGSADRKIRVWRR
jgi:hypothetical protein